MKPLLIDTFCCAGGASKGYHDAGFDVIGVDKEPQPNYPFEFRRDDAVHVLARIAAGEPPWPGVRRPDALAGSPPCQGYSGMTNCRPGVAETYPQLIDVTRDLMQASGLPWVIENVEGSGLAEQADLFGAEGLVLCGHHVRPAAVPAPAVRGVVPARRPASPAAPDPGAASGPLEARDDHLRRRALRPYRRLPARPWASAGRPATSSRESIPPAYTTYIGLALMTHLQERAA